MPDWRAAALSRDPSSVKRSKPSEAGIILLCLSNLNEFRINKSRSVCMQLGVRNLLYTVPENVEV